MGRKSREKWQRRFAFMRRKGEFPACFTKEDWRAFIRRRAGMTLEEKIADVVGATAGGKVRAQMDEAR
jgi:hypothetical protein